MLELRALHLDTAAGWRFALVHSPSRASRGTVVHVHALAEEMNKSRRMVALQARRLALAGYTVVVPDLFGCGDSEGDFASATWEQWLDDVASVTRWAADRSGQLPLWLWGHRAGALLATEAALRLPEVTGLLAWQPPANGRAALQQLLRVRWASTMQRGAGRDGPKALAEALADGDSIDVAGYVLSPGLYAGIDRAEMHAPRARAVWLETSTAQEPKLAPASARTLQQWRSRGSDVLCRVVAGPPFWHTAEIETAPALIDATTQSVLVSSAMVTA
jgi:exosortase A-associated hydrolase 2